MASQLWVRCEAVLFLAGSPTSGIPGRAPQGALWGRGGVAYRVCHAQLVTQLFKMSDFCALCVTSQAGGPQGQTQS